jgi:hypothetical protein
MYIKQLSIFIENKHGRLAEVTSLIANAGIDIRAISIADTNDFGILRLVVNKPEEAEKVLKDANLTVALTDVIAVGIPDRPGGIAETLTAIADKDVEVEYMYEYVARNSDHAYFVMRVADKDKAIATLQAQGCDLLRASDVTRY